MIQLQHSPYRYRYLNRFIVEAVTPIAIGNGEESIMTNRLVLRDVNGLPYLPGTSIAGVLLHAMREVDTNAADKFFGNQQQGSQFIFTEGRLVGPDGYVIDGYCENESDSDFFNLMHESPIRQHVRINSRGTAEKGGKYDQEIVPCGTRFCFEVEFLAENKDGNEALAQLLNLICSCQFRLGGGTRNGHGELVVRKHFTATIDLCEKDDQKSYILKPSHLGASAQWSGWRQIALTMPEDEKYDLYELRLRPYDFYFFGSGVGDQDVDDTPLSESFIIWKEDKAIVSKQTKKILPATSLKGVISHRVAYYYNKATHRYANQDGADINKENLAVTTLFGTEGDDSGKGRKRGCILFSDIVEQAKSEMDEKVFNHVTINQFTGGAKEGNLFDEKTIYAPQEVFLVKILVPKTGIETEIKEAFISALRDICNGMLPLGGLTNRGHGTFHGKLSINHKEEQL